MNGGRGVAGVSQSKGFSKSKYLRPRGSFSGGGAPEPVYLLGLGLAVKTNSSTLAMVSTF